MRRQVLLRMALGAATAATVGFYPGWLGLKALDEFVGRDRSGAATWLAARRDGVYCCAWRIETPEEIIASSEDPREQLETAVRHLDGRRLSQITIERPSLSATFTLSGSTWLRTFSIFSREYEHWMFYLPDGNVFTAGPGSTWSLGR